MPENVECNGACDFYLLFSTESGRVFATGLNDFGQLGIGSSMTHTLVLDLVNHTSLCCSVTKLKALRLRNNNPNKLGQCWLFFIRVVRVSLLYALFLCVLGMPICMNVNSYLHVSMSLYILHQMSDASRLKN